MPGRSTSRQGRTVHLPLARLVRLNLHRQCALGLPANLPQAVRNHRVQGAIRGTQRDGYLINHGRLVPGVGDGQEQPTRLPEGQRLRRRVQTRLASHPERGHTAVVR